jgi:hypothetical protein
MKGGSFVEYFRDLDDPRQDNKRHNLIDIVVLSICAVICGALTSGKTSKSSVKTKRAGWEDFWNCLMGFLPMIRSRRVFAALDAEQLKKTCKRSIAGKRLLAGWDNNYLEKLLFSS